MNNKIHLDEIREVLNRPGFEGPQQLRGYIPCHLTTGGTANYYGGPNPERYVPMGISGVTVGTGVDLGQTDAATLGGMGVSPGIVNQLRPYLGQRRAAAVAVLHRLPLTLRQDVADDLDVAMLSHHVTQIADYYDRAVGVPGRFATLPWQAQAVIVSIQYQRGVNSPRKYPNTWKAFVSEDWADASARLKNVSLWSGYQRRRRLEGQLLEQLL